MAFHPTDDRSPDTEREGPVGAALAAISPLEGALWTLVLVALVLDVALTAYGLSIGLAEGNPVMRRAFEAFGIGALVLGKAVALAIALAVRVRWPQRPVVPPLALAIPWVLAVGINAALVSGV